MSRLSRIKAHLSLLEVQARHARAEGGAERRRWLIVMTLLAAPRTAQEVARQLCCSASKVNQAVAAYNRLGPVAFAPPAAPRRGAALLSLEEERRLLAGFCEPARAGALTSVAPVRASLEARVGGAVHGSTVRRLLARHGWRKLVPRPRHPEADPEAQQAYKKSFPRRLPKP